MDATDTPQLAHCQVCHVLSSKSSAYGLVRAQSRQPPVPTSVFSLVTFKKQGKSRDEYDVELARRIKETKPDLVVLAGWMLVLGPAFLDALTRDWPEPDDSSPEASSSSPYDDPSRVPMGKQIPIINLHPALPGAFPGAHAIENAYEAFQKGDIKETGIMIHKVIPELDAGEPLVVKKVEIVAGESLEQLEERIHKVEHVGIVEGVAKSVELIKSGAWWS